jgi:hypothetical protein
LDVKSNEYSLKRRDGVYGTRKKKRNAIKYRSTIPYPKILEARNVRNSEILWILEMEYRAYIVYYTRIISPADSVGSTP